MKYSGLVTPFHGICVYARSAMGMPSSETALEVLMCNVLGDFLEAGFFAKILWCRFTCGSDDLFCGADSPGELLKVWSIVLHILENATFDSQPKNVICLKPTTILRWV